MTDTIKTLIKKITPDFLINWYHLLWAFLGALIYGFPSKKLKVIGVTGTKGKTTIVNFISSILEEAGYVTALSSSTRFKVGALEWENRFKMTMPGRFTIQKLLSRAKKEKCDYAIIEVTSEGIKQYRHRFIDFNIAVFANLSPEHIEAHKGFQNYLNAKIELFRRTKEKHIINIDDENSKYFWQEKAKEKWGFGIATKRTAFKKIIKQAKPETASILEAENIKTEANRIFFDVQASSFNLNLLGQFNIYNALAAISTAVSENISLILCARALSKIKKVSGRMDVVSEKPLVVVDYAHNPSSLSAVYRSLKSLKKGKIICVLGACGGGRDKWKRQEMGKLAFKYCNKIIITNEDPYDEDPVQIINQVSRGAREKAEKILDRKKAIKKAVAMAKESDIVIITGKGSEPWMCVERGRKIPWDDRKIAREELQKLKKIK